MFRLRCSALGQIMAKSSGLTEKQQKELDTLIAKGSKSKKLADLIAKRDFKPEFDLSIGAMSYVKNYVQKELLEIESNLSTKQLEKGILVEDDSIELYNYVFFTSYEKNTERITNEYLTGECDINAELEDMIIDIKSSYTKSTFPLFEDDAHCSSYEWQLRGYMMLYNRNKARLAFCLVNTPDHLISQFEDYNLHDVEDLDPLLRVTTIDYERCKEKEKEIIYKIKECKKYYHHCLDIALAKNR